MNVASRHAWVIGRGGLLGSALERALARTRTTQFVPDRRFPWNDADVLHRALASACERFAASIGPGDRWEIHWAAGVGTMSSKEGDVAPETAAFAALLAAIERSTLDPAHGRLTLASSAGAIYAGSTDAVIDERTPECPTTPYAAAKLAQERRLREHGARVGTGILIARISTVYGPGQASAKTQGLLTHISRCVIRNVPIQIFVPLDTIRDYIAADDAAAMMLDAVDRIVAGRVVTKIVASEQPVTISEILSIFKRLARRPPRIVTSGSSASRLYTRRIQYRSVEQPLPTRAPVNLLIGISRLLAAERLRYVASTDRVTGS